MSQIDQPSGESLRTENDEWSTEERIWHPLGLTEEMLEMSDNGNEHKRRKPITCQRASCEETIEYVCDGQLLCAACSDVYVVMRQALADERSEPTCNLTAYIEYRVYANAHYSVDDILNCYHLQPTAACNWAYHDTLPENGIIVDIEEYRAPGADQLNRYFGPTTLYIKKWN